jgi:hypothetical protein
VELNAAFNLDLITIVLKKVREIIVIDFEIGLKI